MKREQLLAMAGLVLMGCPDLQKHEAKPPMPEISPKFYNPSEQKIVYAEDEYPLLLLADKVHALPGFEGAKVYQEHGKGPILIVKEGKSSFSFPDRTNDDVVLAALSQSPKKN